ncbi:MAG: alpha-amylase family protein [Intrasporangium sp.]|uniref:alpha-amylase family protein n=1 Tax=Intrasporangium sp. TaxID=1925024 RepID=UPI003F7F32D3
MRTSDTADLWWRNAVIYCLDPQTYLDTDGNGQGDLQGVIDRIDYLAELGVTCIWLMPFFETPDRDDGYDVSDYYVVDRRLGSLGDFVELVRMARSRGIRVIIDLVMNHTSDEHPWFKQARQSPTNRFRDYYVWRKKPPKNAKQNIIFPEVETSTWAKDDKTGEYYLHHFYSHQPDLNVSNPKVREEIAKNIGFWLELGVAGFRVDSVPFLFDNDGVDEAGAHYSAIDYLREIREFVARRSGDGVLLGEVNLHYDEQRKWFGGEAGDGLHMQFDFMTTQHLFLALARQDGRPLIKSLKQRLRLGATNQWATFVRNHDELTLDLLTNKEREDVFAAFGPDPDMRIFGRGIRRRVPPMLEDDARTRLAYAFIFSLPGSPCLFYGEEIGMGENLEVEGRHAVRTPMQWSPEGGFSEGDPKRMVRPMPDGDWGPKKVNVESERHDPNSMWRFMQRLIRAYRESPQLAWSSLELIEQDNPSVVAHVCRAPDDGWAMIALHNFGEQGTLVELDLPGTDTDGVLVDRFDGSRLPFAESGTARVEVDGYGFRWFTVGQGLP